MAWRNAPKCCNRKFWDELQLIDRRHCNSSAEMYQACLDLLEQATLSSVTTANICVFRPQTPGSADGPRIWNTQLVRRGGGRLGGGPRAKEGRREGGRTNVHGKLIFKLTARLNTEYSAVCCTCYWLCLSSGGKQVWGRAR